jgi:hypothetical protein
MFIVHVIIIIENSFQIQYYIQTVSFINKLFLKVESGVVHFRRLEHAKEDQLPCKFITRTQAYRIGQIGKEEQLDYPFSTPTTSVDCSSSSGIVFFKRIHQHPHKLQPRERERKGPKRMRTNEQ